MFPFYKDKSSRSSSSPGISLKENSETSENIIDPREIVRKFLCNIW